MIFIYAKNITPRLHYVCEFIFTEYYGTAYKISGNLSEINNSGSCVLNYSEENIPSAQTIIPSGLLSETGIRKTELKFTGSNGKNYFFPNEKSFTGFDIFSSVFFLISRYEEYLPFTADRHGRFPATESFAFKNNFLRVPVADQWLLEFELQLKKLNPDLKFREHKFAYHSTIDIDNAYAFKGKNLKRFGGAMARSVIKGNFNDVAMRTKFLQRKIQDPFDHYDFQLELSKATGIPLTYFILNAEKSEFDVSLPPGNAEFIKLIQKISNATKVGIHPSYASFLNETKIKKELQDLSIKAGKRISTSRQHFLKFKFPETPRVLMNCGIKEDFSMGYSTHNGFRAGTAQPFYFYDLEKEEKKDLKFFPFQVMDSVFYDQKKESAVEAWPEIKSVCDEIKKVNGTFISVWHDRGFDENQLPGWKNNYIRLHEYCKG